MALTLTQWRDTLLLLLPRGSAFTRDPESGNGQWCQGLAEEWARVDARIDQLLTESDPSTTSELIDDWEIDWGLPSECTGPLVTLAERRQALLDRIVNIPNQSRQTYVDRAAALGYTVTVTEYESGDSVPGYGGIPTADAGFVVQINVIGISGSGTTREHGSIFGEAFGWEGDTLLECALRQIAPTHNFLIFAYP